MQQEHQQTNIFRDDQQQLNYAELCNAFYQRELVRVAQIADNGLLRRRLQGLAHHIQRVSHLMTQHASPLSIDFHNASWQHKQSSNCPQQDISDKVHAWWHKYADWGLTVPVLYQDHNIYWLELDSIDMLAPEEEKLHLNKSGWFSFYGQSNRDKGHSKRQLLLPNKRHFVAACCGHRWQQKRKLDPRTLTLREMLLSTEINWKNFKQAAAR